MNKKIIIGIAVSLLLIAAIGFTYAFFSSTVEGNDNAKDQIVETGTLSLVYKDGPELRLDGAYPGNKIEKIVSVTNTGTLSTGYNIFFKDLINTIENDELQISFTCTSYTEYTDTENKGTQSGSCENLNSQAIPFSNIASNSTITEEIQIEPGITHEYLLVIEFIEINDEQNYNQGKTFSSLINIVGQDSVQNTLLDVILKDNEEFADNESSTYVSAETGINFAAMSSDTNGKGLYYTTDTKITEDLDGDNKGEKVYYFRGDVDNNFVKFGTHKNTKIEYQNTVDEFYYSTESECTKLCEEDYKNYSPCSCNKLTYYSAGDEMCWRIVRTTEDGSVKLRYSGVADESGACPQTGTKVQISSGAFYQSQYNDEKYMGYTFLNETSQINSTAKEILETWYENELSDVDDLISNVSYCNDRSNPSSPTSGTRVNYKFHGASHRLYNITTLSALDSVQPTFKCANDDSYTVNDGSGKGNGYLSKPIGLLTADEVAYAGGVWIYTDEYRNTDFYLYTSSNYWTMSPSYLSDSNTYYGISGNMFLVEDYGSIGFSILAARNNMIIPVIALKKQVQVSEGKGTYDEPYIIG